jgi:hypothetical protein
MISEASIIYSARQRTGITLTDAVGSEYISDVAIKREIAENILECCKAFGAATSSKEVDFVTVTAPVLSPPIPVLTPSPSGGTLLAATYGYRVSAIYGTKETLVGALAEATTTGSTSSIAVSWTAVPSATGYKVYGRTSGLERLLATVTTTTWTDTGSARPGSGPQIRDSTGQAMQEYEIGLFLGDDILQIVDVLRSDAYHGDNAIQFPRAFDPLISSGNYGRHFVDQSLQESAFEVMQAQERYRELQKFSWAIVNIDSVRYLRLMPPPRHHVLVRCTYISVADSISSLPDEAKPAMENAACRAILDCVLNRVKAEPMAIHESPLESRAFIEAMVKQRDRYHDRYMQCVSAGR